jgi:cytochrome P450
MMTAGDATVGSKRPIDTNPTLGVAVPSKRVADLPGPRGWPLLGNLLQIDLPSMHLQLEAWADTWGPLYRIRLANRDVLVVTRPDLIASMLRDRPDGWRRLSKTRAVLDEMGPPGLFAAEGDPWRRQRRLVASAFAPGPLKRYFPLIERVTERLKDRLDKAARGGEWVDLQGLLMLYTVDVTASLAFGIDVNTLEQGGDALQKHLDKVLPTLMRRIHAPFPYWHYFKFPSDRDFDRDLAICHATVAGFIQTARDRMAADPGLFEHPTNMLEAMLAARDAEGGGLSEGEVIGNVLTMLIAGEDTTANTLAWTLYLLRQHPETWRELVAEAEAALGQEPLARSFAVADGLCVARDCASEAMRLRPVAPVLLLENNKACEIDGIAIPADSFAICVMRSGAVDTATAPDAGDFRPSRWRTPMDPADQALTAASMPFGGGPRICPGRYLAMIEMKMVLSMLARNYELIEVGTEDGEPPRERLAFAMSPVGLRMKLAMRRNP